MLSLLLSSSCLTMGVLLSLSLLLRLAESSVDGSTCSSLKTIAKDSSNPIYVTGTPAWLKLASDGSLAFSRNHARAFWRLSVLLMMLDGGNKCGASKNIQSYPAWLSFLPGAACAHVCESHLCREVMMMMMIMIMMTWYFRRVRTVAPTWTLSTFTHLLTLWEFWSSCGEHWHFVPIRETWRLDPWWMILSLPVWQCVRQRRTLGCCCCCWETWHDESSS